MSMDVPLPDTLATTNRNKIAEYGRIAAKIGQPLTLQPLAEKRALLEVQSVDPRQVSVHKAIDAMMKFGKPMLVEDGGFHVEAFHGAPGALYAPVIEKGMGNERLLRALQGEMNRTAKAVITIAFADADGHRVYLATGETTGIVPQEARGKNGFGYDPILELPELGLTLAEMTDDQKDELFARRQALERLLRGEWDVIDIA